MKRNALLALMESVWLLALLLLIDAVLPYASPILWVLLLYPVAFGLARLIPIRDERLWVELAVSGGLLAAIIAIAGCAVLLIGGFGGGIDAHPVGRFVLASLLGAYGWARGWWRARFDIDAKGFVTNFQFGLAMMVAALFGLSELHAPIEAQAGLAVAFAAVGLVGLATARPTEAAASDMTGRLASILAILFGLATVFALAGIFWLLVNRTALDGIVSTATEAGRRLAAFFAGLFPAPDSPSAALTPLQPPPPLPPHPDDVTKPPEEVSLVGPVILIGATLAAVAVIFIRQLLELLRRFRSSKRTAGVTYGVAGASFLMQLRDFLMGFAAAIIRAARYLSGRLRTWLTPQPAAGFIRQRYKQLLRRLAFRGRRRFPYETPSEYHRRLAALWPGSDPDFAKFTETFVAECYGGKLADPTEVEAVWARLRPTIRKIRGPNG